MEINEIGQQLSGWEYFIRFEGGQYEIIVWKPEWKTDDLYQSMPLPTGKGSTIKQALEDLFSSEGA